MEESSNFMNKSYRSNTSEDNFNRSSSNSKYKSNFMKNTLKVGKDRGALGKYSLNLKNSNSNNFSKNFRSSQSPLNTSNNLKSNNLRANKNKLTTSNTSSRKNLQNSFSSTGSGKNRVNDFNSCALTKDLKDNWKEKFYQVVKDNENLKTSLVKERQQNQDLGKRVKQMEKSISENEKLNEKLNKLVDSFEKLHQDFTQSEIIRREQSNLIKSLQNEVEMLRVRNDGNVFNENNSETFNKINPNYYLYEKREEPREPEPRETRDNIFETEKIKVKKKKLKSGKSKSKEKTGKTKNSSKKLGIK